MPIACKYCDKIFSRQFSRNRHIREIHVEQVEPVSYAKEVWGFKCLEHDCDTSFQQGPFLIDHLERVHNLKFESEIIMLDNMDEFTNWKQSIEEVSCSYYVISKNMKDRSTKYFNCNRSKTGHDGHRKLDKQYKRKRKSQGLLHMNSLCTSQIKMLCDKDGKVTVNFRKTHYGHVANLAQVRLPKHESEKIAAKLDNGVPTKKIVQTVCDNNGEHLKRIDSVSLKNGTESNIELFCAVFDKSKETTEEKLNKKVNHVFCKLQNFDYNTLDDSTLEKIHYHLNIVENLTNLPHNMDTKESDFVTTENTNKRYINPQLRFFSIKKKKASTSCTINVSDMERSETKMLQNRSALVISSNSTEDHLYCKT